MMVNRKIIEVRQGQGDILFKTIILFAGHLRDEGFWSKMFLIFSVGLQSLNIINLLY